ncbi:hypothetical protein ABGB14_37395 [Nonomuraea sp. B10E15]|uniref:hypothetical protein n=1 Tax=Nonomuraea sp. B10E15 TaxID=3153560 RepID=UPI00325D7C9F
MPHVVAALLALPAAAVEHALDRAEPRFSVSHDWPTGVPAHSATGQKIYNVKAIGRYKIKTYRRRHGLRPYSSTKTGKPPTAVEGADQVREKGIVMSLTSNGWL